MLDFSTHVLLTCFSSVALSSLTNFIKSLSLFVTFFFTFGMTCQLIGSMYICQFMNNRFVRNLKKNRSDETLKTPWGKWDILDCHMGVMWLDAARLLVASRRSIIFFYQNIAICPSSCNHIPTKCGNKLYWIFFIHLRQNDFWPPRHRSGSCHRPPNSQPN